MRAKRYDRGQVQCHTYYAALMKEHLPLAIDLLTDIVFHSTYPAAELEKEKGSARSSIADHVSATKDPAFPALDAEYQEVAEIFLALKVALNPALWVVGGGLWEQGHGDGVGHGGRTNILCFLIQNGQIKLKCPICTLQSLFLKTVSVPMTLKMSGNRP